LTQPGQSCCDAAAAGLLAANAAGSSFAVQPATRSFAHGFESRLNLAALGDTGQSLSFMAIWFMVKIKVKEMHGSGSRLHAIPG